MYSQNNEEEIILNYFGKYIGTFLDLGANDGVTLSNTYELYKRGWTGTVVEASEKAFNRMPYITRVCKINAAIGVSNGETLLYESGEHLGTGDVALLSSIRPSEIKRWIGETFTGVKVECINFKTLLKRSSLKTFDFISMDIEGMELDVLPQMNFKKLETKLICVEFNGKEKEKYDSLILPQGFHLIHMNGENLIYAKD